MNNTTARNGRSFIIVEPDPIVSLDLTGILNFGFPASTVVRAQDVAEAEHLITGAMPSVCVLVNADVASGAMLDLLRACVMRGGEVLFIGEARDVGFAACFVRMPFTSGMIITTLTGRAPDPK